MARAKPEIPTVQVPLRFEPDLIRRLKEYAETKGLSMNAAAKALLDGALLRNGVA